MWRMIAVIAIFFMAVNMVYADEQDEDWSYEQLNVIFMVNDDGTLSLVLDAEMRFYPLKLRDILWIIPVPSIPTVEFLPNDTLRTLKRITEPHFIVPHNPCENVIHQLNDAHYGYSDGTIPLDNYEIVAGDDLDVALQRWQDAGYLLQADTIPILHEYAQAGMMFVAIIIPQGYERYAGVQPIQLTYQADTPILPILLTATPTHPDMQVWIFADEPYRPQNIAHPTLDYADFHTYSQLYNLYYRIDEFSVINAASLSAFYYPLIDEQIGDGGGVFVTEFAMPTTWLQTHELLVDAPIVTNWMRRFDYLTRLRGQFGDVPLSQDPIFTPAPDFADMTMRMDLGDVVDPLHFWGCSTRAIQEAPYPALDGVWLDNQFIEYPQGWIMSEIVGLQDLPFIIFSPETITLDTLYAFFEGQATPPMLLYMPPNDLFKKNEYSSDYYYEWHNYIVMALGLDTYDDVGIYYYPSIKTHQYARDWYKYEFFHPYNTNLGVFLLLTTQDDAHANRDLYDAIEQSSFAHPYYAHPDLRHTLFLTTVGQENYYYLGIVRGMLLGFPQGWIEQSLPNNEVIITPENTDEPSIRLIPYTHFNLSRKTNMQILIPTMALAYGVLEDDLARMWDLRPRFPTFIGGCNGVQIDRLDSFQFEKDGRVGYIAFSNDYLIVASAPTSLFDKYRHMLQASANSMALAELGCG